MRRRGEKRSAMRGAKTRVDLKVDKVPGVRVDLMVDGMLGVKIEVILEVIREVNLGVSPFVITVRRCIMKIRVMG